MKINILSADEIIKKRGLQPGGRVQEYFPQRLLFYGEKRTPKQNSDLIQSAKIQNGGREIYYPGPYARYLWHGVAMKGSDKKEPVINPDPDRDPNTPGELQFQEATTRGKFWLERTWTDDGNKILQEVAEEAGGRVK